MLSMMYSISLPCILRLIILILNLPLSLVVKMAGMIKRLFSDTEL